MKRAVTYLLIACFALLGSGLFAYLHELEHQFKDSRIIATAAKSEMPKPVIPVHDETNCDIHSMLRAPILLVYSVPVLVCLGWIVAFLSESAPKPVSIDRILRIDCRGPPAIA